MTRRPKVFNLDVLELVRFGFSGAINTILAYGVYALALSLKAPYILALIFDYSFAVVFSLLANKFFTFKGTGPITPATVLKMIASYVLMYAVNALILWALIDRLQVNPYFAQAGATVVIGFCSYVFQKHVVFSPEAHRK